VQPDGAIVVAGNATSISPGGGSDLALVRLLNNGTPDPGFGDGGLVLAELSVDGTREDRVRGLQLLPDGRMVVAGSSMFDRGAGAHLEFMVARLLGDGSFDGSFNTTGRRFTRVSFTALEQEASDVAVQSDGKILLGGTVQNSDGSRDFALVRMTPEGPPDAGYGTGCCGSQIVPFDLVTAGNDRASALVLDGGRALLVGQAQAGASGNDDFAVARLTSALIFQDGCESGNLLAWSDGTN
jgi:uncharacterized delta-60 repeat protein